MAPSMFAKKSNSRIMCRAFGRDAISRKNPIDCFNEISSWFLFEKRKENWIRWIPIRLSNGTYVRHFIKLSETYFRKLRMSASFIKWPQSFIIKLILHACAQREKKIIEFHLRVYGVCRSYQNAVAICCDFFLQIHEIYLLWEQRQGGHIVTADIDQCGQCVYLHRL